MSRYRSHMVTTCWARSLILLLLLLTVILAWKFWTITNKETEYTVDLTPLRNSAYRSENITILVVINAESDFDEYRYSLSTISCYAQLHNYTLRIVSDNEYTEVCKQKDYMFRRHCIAAEILAISDWMLFLDADIGVVNPKRFIEEYLEAAYDLTFYDRFTSWEIAMGSYIARRSEWSIDFLRQFADYENRLPDSFHGTDNGAIHAFLVERLLSSSMDAAKPCLSIWHQSKGYDDLFLFEACIRAIIGDRSTINRFRIIPKGRGWVRDIWLTDSMWSPQRDFMLHGMKASDRIQNSIEPVDALRKMFTSRFAWRPFLKTEIRAPDCKREGAWVYDEKLMVSEAEIERILTQKHRDVERRRWRQLARIASFV